VSALASVLGLGLLLSTTLVLSVVCALRGAFDRFAGDNWLYGSHRYARLKVVGATHLLIELALLATLTQLLVTLFLD
jgi:hypothetical protein